MRFIAQSIGRWTSNTSNLPPQRYRVTVLASGQTRDFPTYESAWDWVNTRYGLASVRITEVDDDDDLCICGAPALDDVCSIEDCVMNEVAQ